MSSFSTIDFFQVWEVIGGMSNSLFECVGGGEVLKGVGLVYNYEAKVKALPTYQKFRWDFDPEKTICYESKWGKKCQFYKQENEKWLQLKLYFSFFYL